MSWLYDQNRKYIWASRGRGCSFAQGGGTAALDLTAHLPPSATPNESIRLFDPSERGLRTGTAAGPVLIRNLNLPVLIRQVGPVISRVCFPQIS
jgi:hypothetical protein